MRWLSRGLLVVPKGRSSFCSAAYCSLGSYHMRLPCQVVKGSVGHGEIWIWRFFCIVCTVESRSARVEHISFLLTFKCLLLSQIVHIA